MKAHISKGAIRLWAEHPIDADLIRSLWKKQKTYKAYYAPNKVSSSTKKGVAGLIEIYLHEVEEDVSPD